MKNFEQIKTGDRFYSNGYFVTVTATARRGAAVTLTVTNGPRTWDMTRAKSERKHVI